MSTKATFFMRVYNVEENLLRRAIESVLKQSEPSFRFIIQDNGSTDKSNEIIREYAKKDDRIDWCRNEVNSKVTPEELQQIDDIFARNIVECQTEYFAIIDSDDYYEEDFLELAYEKALKTNADIVFAGYKQIDLEGNKLTEKVPAEESAESLNISNGLFQESYPFIRTFWANLYSVSLWERYWEIIRNDKPSYMKNGLDTYVNLQLLKEGCHIALLSKCVYAQTRHNKSIYHSDVRTERALEGDELFLSGLQVAQNYGILNENTLSFLASVYYYHMVDIVHNVVKSQDKQRIRELFDILNRSEVYQMLAEKGKDFQTLIEILRIKGN